MTTTETNLLVEPVASEETDRYLVRCVRAWTKEGLCQKLMDALDGYPPEDIVSIQYQTEGILVGRRNSALLTLKRL